VKSLVLAIFIWSILAAVSPAQSLANPLVLDRRVLDARRAAFLSSAQSERSATARKLIKSADRLVAKGKTFSVMKKSPTPPSGDKHDYMSQAPYWWPDPSKPNGLPYIRRDGERNPELSRISDHDELDQMLEDSEVLALAYYFSNEEKYAKQAAAVLRAWFLDPETKQNPNLKFAQGIPGIGAGRGIGLIETRHFHRAIDAAILLQSSRSWTRDDHESLKKWFGQFLDWIIESPLGKDEADERNNHGTYYDVQVVTYAIFTGRTDLARKQLEVTKSRIASQIEPDGSQPHELARTLSWGYVNMNLMGFFTLARLSESVNVDLWNYKTADGRSIKSAFEWLVPYAANEKEWTHKQLKPRTFELTARLLNIGAAKYKDPRYAAITGRLETTGDGTFRSLGIY
jgi:hypothetical protein